MSGFGSFCEGLPSWSSSQHGGDITHGHTAPLEDDNYNSSNPDGQEVNAEPVDWQGLSELQTHELQGHIYTNSLPSTVSPAMDPLAMDSAITSDHLAAMNQLASTVSDYGWQGSMSSSQPSEHWPYLPSRNDFSPSVMAAAGQGYYPYSNLQSTPQSHSSLQQHYPAFNYAVHQMATPGPTSNFGMTGVPSFMNSTPNAGGAQGFLMAPGPMFNQGMVPAPSVSNSTSTSFGMLDPSRNTVLSSAMLEQVMNITRPHPISTSPSAASTSAPTGFRSRVQHANKSRSSPYQTPSQKVKRISPMKGQRRKAGMRPTGPSGSFLYRASVARYLMDRDSYLLPSRIANGVIMQLWYALPEQEREEWNDKARAIRAAVYDGTRPKSVRAPGRHTSLALECSGFDRIAIPDVVAALREDGRARFDPVAFGTHSIDLANEGEEDAKMRLQRAYLCFAERERLWKIWQARTGCSDPLTPPFTLEDQAYTTKDLSAWLIPSSQ
ncbi:hypothetical protein PHLGIDRAFT_515441 [Phlebiopsis gigantea 11061_1 CR5-6]|uniref:Uncharacterized protein n=1 Tax=Phlebiopsis gigantea (strain 11061_1 CR5-6) TaxID=745531 RepID=A0A0C3RXB2_PHLG1|nr:hypothetical protein PHLGIDRAFT_515441 [Phlebiopsis gigantea 11061_1 CR5-6]